MDPLGTPEEIPELRGSFGRLAFDHVLASCLLWRYLGEHRAGVQGFESKSQPKGAAAFQAGCYVAWLKCNSAARRSVCPNNKPGLLLGSSK